MTGPARPRAGDPPAGLLADVVGGFARLVRGEIALARAEAERSLREAARAIACLVVAVVLGITGLNVLAGAAVAGLVALGLSPLLASAILGAGLTLLALGYVQYGLSLLSPSNLAPRRTWWNLRRDAETLKDMVKSDETADLHA